MSVIPSISCGHPVLVAAELPEADAGSSATEVEVDELKRVCGGALPLGRLLSSVCKPLLEAADNGLLDKGSFDRCVLSEEDNCGMKALRPLTINICFRLILHVIQVREEIGAPGLDFQGGAEHVWGTPVRNILQLRGGR